MRLARYVNPKADNIFTRDERATLDLADRLKEFIEEQNPLADQGNLYSDLLGGALSGVNWYEIAEYYIKDLDNSEFEEGKEDVEQLANKVIEG